MKQNIYRNNYLLIAGLALAVASLALISYFVYTAHHQKIDDFKLDVTAQKYRVAQPIK